MRSFDVLLRPLGGDDAPDTARNDRPPGGGEDQAQGPEHLRDGQNQRHRRPQCQHHVDGGQDQDEVRDRHECGFEPPAGESCHPADRQASEEGAERCDERDRE